MDKAQTGIEDFTELKGSLSGVATEVGKIRRYENVLVCWYGSPETEVGYRWFYETVEVRIVELN